jgi:hypothetical protein
LASAVLAAARIALAQGDLDAEPVGLGAGASASQHRLEATELGAIELDREHVGQRRVDVDAALGRT